MLNGGIVVIGSTLSSYGNTVSLSLPHGNADDVPNAIAMIATIREKRIATRVKNSNDTKRKSAPINLNLLFYRNTGKVNTEMFLIFLFYYSLGCSNATLQPFVGKLNFFGRSISFIFRQ